jgi:integrase
MTMTITTVISRNALKARHEPYWNKLAKGCHLGFRKQTPTSTGNWYARHIETGTNKKTMKSLGAFEQLPPSQRFDAAKRDAETWFEHIGMGGISSPKTIKDVCDHYVEQIVINKGEKAAIDVRKRFAGYVLNQNRFAELEISKLTPALVQQWRNRLTQMPTVRGIKGMSRQSAIANATNPPRLRSASTLNRDMTPFRAALNLAFRDGWVTSDFAWRNKLTPVVNADKKRDLYLDHNQRTQLVQHARKDISEFVRGLATLPLRPGALANLKVSDFDERLMQLSIKQDKTGARKIKLPENTGTILKQLCADRPATQTIFVDSKGKPWNKDSWKKLLKKAALDAGLSKETTSYTLRHSVITDLVHSKLDLLTVSQLAGTSVRMIEQHYGHLRSELALPALAALEI